MNGVHDDRWRAQIEESWLVNDFVAVRIADGLWLVDVHWSMLSRSLTTSLALVSRASLSPSSAGSGEICELDKGAR